MPGRRIDHHTDKVRGKYATLEEAALHYNLPTLKQTKSKFIFLLDTRDAKLALLKKGHPSLKKRILFTNSDPDTPEATVMIRNGPRGPYMPQLIKKVISSTHGLTPVPNRHV